jgi:predicted outer membrane repeat protein
MKHQLVGSILASVVSTGISMADTLVVPGEYGSIQSGISAALSGDTVLVAPGIYYETINFQGKDITVSSSGSADDTYIDGNVSSGSIVMFVSGETNTSILDGFTVRNGTAQNGSGIFIASSSPRILNCIVTSNHSSNNGGGIYVETGGITLEDVIVSDNISNSAGAGLYLKMSNGSMTGGSIEGNIGVNGAGMYLKDGDGPFEMTDVVVQQNIASNNGGGVYAKNSPVTVDSCMFIENATNNGGGWFSWSDGDANFTNCSFEGNTATNVGGAANIKSSTVEFDSCLFDSNIADSDCNGTGAGAVLEIVNSAVTLTNPTMCENYVCETDGDFSGDAPVIVGDILECTTGIGACCGGPACWEMDEETCLNGGGTWNGDATLCATVTCEGSNSGCAADLNGNGSVEVLDIIELISAWGACP